MLPDESPYNLTCHNRGPYTRSERILAAFGGFPLAAFGGFPLAAFGGFPLAAFGGFPLAAFGGFPLDGGAVALVGTGHS